MTEQLSVGHQPYSLVLTFNSPAVLPPSHREHTLAVTLEPPALFVRKGGQWVPIASVEGNVPAPTVVNASEAAAGIAPLATQEETNAGTDPYRILTPARLSGRTATETRTGLVELAGAAAAEAGTDDTRAVHPAGVKAAMTPEGWIAPTLQNGWTNLGGSNAQAGYRKEFASNVRLRGTVGGGTTGQSAPVFTLPVGYRPPADLTFVVQSATSSTVLTIFATGVVSTLASASNASLGLNVVFAL